MKPTSQSILRGAAGRMPFLASLLFASASLAQQEPVPVPFGPAGSYASFPSPSEDAPGHDVSGVLDRTLYIDPSQAGKPVPTNEWWTDLIISRYAGDLWARPFTVSANATGVKISYPTSWNTGGTTFELGTALEVSGDVDPSPDASDIVMADFESGYPVGWTRGGSAFPAAPAQGTLSGQSLVTGYLGARLANSFDGGDGPTGSLVSPSFTVDRNYITFLVGGGNHPGVAEVRLVIGGSTVLAATGVNSEELRWVNWDVSAHAGQTARIEVVDNATGGWGHILADQIIRTNSTESPAIRFATTFRPDSAQALRWGDWNVAFRMPQLTGPSLDVSLARGVPFVWLETDGVKPTLKAATMAQFYTSTGATLSFPVTTDRFAMVIDGKAFGIHAPDSSTFTLANGVVHSELGADYLVISALPAVADLDTFHARAFAVPRNTRVSWSYSPADGEVTTSWQIDTVALEGSNLDTIQGWLPHHYRGTDHNLAFQAGLTYATPRGPLQCTIGRGGWQVGYGFEGISPVLPLPEVLGKPNDFSPATLKKYLDDYAGETGYGGDTYWGGKSLTQLGEYMLMAKQAGETGAYAALKDSLRTALTDWFTYDQGETEHYFARYENWGAVVGFNDSYGSHEFVDHHFHYGYFTRAAGLLAFEDPDFAAGYGEMATLVAKQYANWDRNDQAFPFLRTFDVWGGHSYAGGFSSPGGNNQESSSEAIQSWAGLFMLGSALSDTGMRDAAAMGYVMERAAVREYWLDVNEDILPAAYGQKSTGILFDNGQAYGTYFSADPAWIYGIQWLPAATHLSYLGWDPEFSKSLMAAMIDDRPVMLGKLIAGGSRYSLWEARQSWYGIHDNALNRDAAIADMKNAINNAYHHNPGYVTALNASNPLYNSATGTLYVTANAAGSLDYPAAYWTPATLPASLIPPNANPATPAEEPVTWNLWQYLGVETNYQVDVARMNELYHYDVLGYDASETDQAADVYSRMGDGLGNVVLGFAAQYDPDFYADVHAELWSRNDAVVKSKSMAGVVYYTSYSNRGLGVPDPSRHTSIPTSQVYRHPVTGAYRYVVYNPSNTEQTATVYGPSGAVGSFPVPARKLVNHGLDQQLESLVVTASNPARTIVPGQTVQFSVTGYDQYGATSPLGTVTWSVSGGGSISVSGLFSATTAQDPVTVTANTGGKSKTYIFRVGAAPVLTNLAVAPGFERVATGNAVTFSASGLDQYGDPIAAGTVTWSTTITGASVTSAGVFTGSSIGVGRVTAASGTKSGSAIVSVQAAQANIALGKTATASNSLGGNTAPAAVDGIAGTRWESQFADNQWLAVDLGASYDLTDLRVDWETAYASSYRVQVSASETGPWTTIREVAKVNANDDELILSGSGRYIRLECLTRGTAYGFSIFELEIRGWLSGSAVTPSVALVNPDDVRVINGGTQAFQAYAFNANAQGGPVAASTWGVSGGGTIDAAGLFTASSVGGPFTVTAAVGSINGTAEVTVGSGSTGSGELINIAPQGSATASSSESAGTRPSYAVDGIAGTRWSSQATDNEYLEIDLGTVKEIRRFDLTWETAYGSQYLIQVRNATSETWVTLVDETAGDGGTDSHEVNASARYVRMQGIDRGTPWGYSLWEFAIMSPAPAGYNLALGKTATASSVENVAYTAGAVVDGSGSTRWSSAYNDDEWLQIDLGSPKTLGSVALVWEGAYAASYVIEGSNNPSAGWSLLAEESAGAGGTETHPVSGSYRYVRMRGIDRATAWGYSLWEFEIR